MVAAAVAVIQGYAKMEKGITLTPEQMRYIISEKYSQSDENDPFPRLIDIRKAIEYINSGS